MDFLKALKIAASAADRPTGNPAAKAPARPPIFGGFRWPAPPQPHANRIAHVLRAVGWRSVRRSPVRVEGFAETARAMMRRAALPPRG